MIWGSQASEEEQPGAGQGQAEEKLLRCRIDGQPRCVPQTDGDRHRGHCAAPLSPVPLQGAGAWVPGDIPEDIPGGCSQLQSQTPTHQLEDQPPNDTLSISTSER